MKRLALTLLVGASLAAALPAAADDHLASAAGAVGGNPVGGNPSGVSGPASDPGSVPGLGDPNAGDDQGTPSVNEDNVEERMARGSDD